MQSHSILLLPCPIVFECIEQKTLPFLLTPIQNHITLWRTHHFYLSSNLKCMNCLDSIERCKVPTTTWVLLGLKYPPAWPFASGPVRADHILAYWLLFNMSLSAFISSISNSSFTKNCFHAKFEISLKCTTLDNYSLNLLKSNSSPQRVKISFSKL